MVMRVIINPMWLMIYLTGQQIWLSSFLKNMYMNTTGKILAGFAAGAAVGAILGILFAPDKGAETRRKINEQGKKMGDDIKNKCNDVKDLFNCAKEEAAKKAATVS
jgi:gas vesicle protein